VLVEFCYFSLILRKGVIGAQLDASHRPSYWKGQLDGGYRCRDAGQREHIEAGGLISYGPNLPDLYRRSTDFGLRNRETESWMALVFR